LGLMANKTKATLYLFFTENSNFKAYVDVH
jgi:hypothetical protein